MVCCKLAEQLSATGATEMKLTPRQVAEIEVEKTSTSCRYGVPVMKFVRERHTVDHGKRYKTYRK